MTYTQYLRQLAADHRESGTTATAEDYEECARRLEHAADVFHVIADSAAPRKTDPDAALRAIERTASTAALDMETIT